MNDRKTLECLVQVSYVATLSMMAWRLRSFLTESFIDNAMTGGWYAFVLISSEGFGQAGGWLPEHGLQFKGLTYRYLRALHWSMGTLTGLTDVAQPTSQLQSLYTILVEVVGLFYFACMIMKKECPLWLPLRNALHSHTPCLPCRHHWCSWYY